MNYTSREVVRRLKQYDMFLNTLNLSTDEVQRERICDQLDKIEKQILLETNAEYEEEYTNLYSKETHFFEDEKARLSGLISLINERKVYLNKRKEEHKKVTGSLVELTTFLGEDKLELFKDKLNIIDKYEENKKKKDKYIKELKVIDIKLSESSRTVKANTRLNEILEKKMKALVKGALEKLNLFSLTRKKSEILNKYNSLEYIYNLANENLKIAGELDNDAYLYECQRQSDEINKEYELYRLQLSIIRLIEMYEDSTSGYEELLRKREEMASILDNIEGSNLYLEIYEEINKQYNTIKLEKKDIEDYEGLKILREEKNNALYDIDKENNSKEFKDTIGEIVKNENKLREENIKKARQEEYDKRQKKLLEEQRLEASRLKRQKLIEESRLKEQQERMEKVKELQEKTVIGEKDKLNRTNVESKITNEFDTEELFENTKIVPNRNQNISDSIFSNLENKNLVKEEIKETSKKTNLIEEIERRQSNKLNSPKVDEKVDEKVAVNQNNNRDLKETVIDKKNTINLNMDLGINNKVPEEKPVVSTKVEEKNIPKKGSSSIYDILENSDNIIWKPVDTVVNNTIPIIENNNLNPTKIGNTSGNNRITNMEGGEALWIENQ